MTKIVLATTNQGKAKEMQLFFATLNNLQWQSLADFNALKDPEETGTTFKANAMLKAEYYGKALNCPVLAEDSGLILEAFPDKFGLRTRRELDARDDHDWLDQFLALTRDEDNRNACFYSAMAYYDPATDTKHLVLGESKGEIVDFPQSPIEAGIPVSSVFLPDGEDEVFGAMNKAEKANVSHRGRAAIQMAEFLKTL